MTEASAGGRPQSLRRVLGKWDLTAFGVNIVIGGAVFRMPSEIASGIGAWSWVALFAVGLLSLCVALNFAEAGSRFDGTGGAYLYTRAAFGRFAGFEVGWLLWVTRVTSWSSIINALTDALGYYWPELRVGLPRAALITGVILTIMAVALRGIRQSQWAVNALTIGKLIPLSVFIIAGLPHVSMAAITPAGRPSLAQFASVALLLIFTYGGYEAAPVMAGEARDPKRDVPFAMVMMILIVTVVMTLAQIVALGTVPGIAASKTPLADGARIFLGPAGAFLMTIGAAVSMTGNNFGASLSASRNLYALAEQRDVPSIFGWVHPRFHTPAVAILFTAAATLTLALTGSFTLLAAVSAMARLVIYVGTCSAVLVLRRRQGPAPFMVPLGPLIPIVGILSSLAILYGATALQREMGAAALAIGALLFAMARWRDR